MSTAQLSPGTVVDGKYTIGAPAHARSGAHSYQATDDQGRPVVLTAYDEACFSSGLVLERSLRELRQLQSLKSPRVASVLACGKLGAGIYEVVEPIPGTRLDAIVAGGAMPALEAAAVIEQIGAGLLEAQKAGVIHRDMGPRVVFVGEQGVVVTSFSVGEPHGDKSFGPLDTIAPEQVEGKVVDQRTLIYNLAALMHMLLTGAPLFPGDAAAQLEAHLRADPPGEVHARLRRALGKEPRMRPMMLKQFLTELRAIGGAVGRAPMAPSKGGPAAPPMPGSDLGGVGATPSAGGGGPPGSTPSSRGWTMFMKADEESTAAAPAAAAPTAAAPTAAAPADVPAKPKTRGWTMFMDAADGEAQEPEPTPAEKPAPKPSTRGWTMFMEDEEASPPASTEATPEPEPAPGGAAPKPSTRGWTMFMEDEEAGEAPPPAAPVETPEPVEAPAPAAAAAPSVGGAAPKPSTRGWTMFMKADEETAAEAVQLATPPAAAPAVATPPAAAPVAAPAVATPPVAAPVAAPAVATPPVAAPAVATPPAAAPAAAAPQVTSAPLGGATAPKSRGWTMFMEPTGEHATVSVEASSEAAEPEQPEPEQPEAEQPEAEPEAGPTPSVTSKRRGDTDAPAKKRGWTMFMEKPISDTSKDELGGVVPSTGESNAKGWTVFSPVASTDGAAGAAAPAPQAAEPAPVSAASVEASPAEPPAEDWTRAKTVVVSGQPSSAPDPAPARVSTMVTPPVSGPAANPPPRAVTMVTPEQEAVAGPMQGHPSGPISEPLSGALAGPPSGPMSGPMSTGLPAPIGPDELEPAKKSNSAVLVVVGLLVAAAVAAAVVMLS